MLTTYNIQNIQYTNIQYTYNIQKYLRSPTNMRMEFKVVTGEEILNIINSLDNKSSSGCDGLSNTMVESEK